MEFTSADRHGDAEFTASLRDYNANVQDYNSARTQNLGTIGDEELRQQGQATAGVLAGALEDGAGCRHSNKGSGHENRWQDGCQ